MFPTLRKHLGILRASWKDQDEADRIRKTRTDHEFLPAALEIMEKPPSPGLRWLLLTLCALFTIALVWAFVGRIDVVAVASGKVIPSANVKVMQAIELGAVRALHVREGQFVRRGELLIELDPTLAGADQAQATQGLLSSRIAEARGDALLAYMNGRAPRFVAPPGTPSAVAATQSRMIRSLVAEYEAQAAGLVQARAGHIAELAGSDAEIAKLEQTLPLVDQQLAARKDLSDKGYFSKLKMLEYEQLRVEHVQNVEVQRSNAAKAAAAIANIDAQLNALRATFAKTASTGLSEAEDQSAVRSEELLKSQRRSTFQQLRAPVDGTVQQLAVHTIGGVVQPAQPLLVIVPSEGAVEVEAQILNKDIGFIREGQPVRVKLEAFPFTDYGIVEGRITSISRDAIDQSQQGPGRDANNRPVQPGLVYSARIRLARSTIRVGDRMEIIGPGLAVQAEIKTGTRRIIEYLLSPIARTMDEAGRER